MGERKTESLPQYKRKLSTNNNKRKVSFLFIQSWREKQIFALKVDAMATMSVQYRISQLVFQRLSSRAVSRSRRCHLETNATTIPLRFMSTSKSSPGKSYKDGSKLVSSVWWPILGGLVITTAGGVKYFHDHFGGSEGLIRTVSFYSLAIPKYIQYRYHMYMQSPDHVWEELDRETSAQGLNKILELQGFYVKCGQYCAANIGNAFPEVWQDTMSVLQDQVPPQSFETILNIIKSELDFDAVFETFEKDPIGSAAIGQVHRATLKDGTP